MAIRKTILATQIALALTVAYTNSYASDVEISLPAATDAFTIDQPAGTELMRVHGNGNVGIGISTPEAALDIRGDSPTKAGINIRNNTAGGSGGLFIDDNAILSLGQPDVAQHLNINLLNSNVGIGTTNPQHSLHVNGTVEVDNTHGSIILKRTEPYTAIGHGNGIITGISPNSKHLGHFGYLNTTTDPDNPQGHFFIQTDTNTNQINESTEHHFNITHAGNVGIGTTAPSDGTANGGQALKLDVEGAIGASTYCDENGENCQTILQLAGGGGADNLGDHTATQNIDLAANKLVGNGGTEGINIDAGGNIGINTTTPEAKLHVSQGSALVDNAQGYWGKLSDGTPAPMLSLHATDVLGIGAGNLPSDIAFWTSAGSTGAQVMTIKNNGNVGIGTANPNAKLEVFDGEIRSTRDVNGTQYVKISGGDSNKTGTYIGAHASESNKKVLEFLSVHDESGSAAGFNGFLFKVGGESAPQSVMAIREDNIGIGTTTPRAGLDIANDAAIPLIVERTSTLGGGFVWQDFMADGNHQWRINGDSSAGAATANLKFSTNDGTTVTPRMTLSADGNVGIGTATPNTATLVLERTTENAIKFEDSGTLRGMLGISANAGQAILDSDAEDFNIRSEDSNLRFSTNAGNNTAVIINPTGNVGIGIADPQQRLEVDGNIKLTTHIMSDSEIKLNPNGGTSDGFKLTGSASTSTLVAHRNELIIGTERDTNASHDDVIFRYTDSDRSFDWMRLDATTENIGIGTASPTETLHIVGNILATGTVTPSDERLKKDIKPLENSLAKIMQLEGVTYKWKDPESLKADTDTQLGLIAQQVEKIVPEVVETANNEQGSKSVSYANLVALLIEATKEQQQLIQTQQTQLEAQQQRIKALEEKIK